MKTNVVLSKSRFLESLLNFCYPEFHKMTPDAREKELCRLIFDAKVRFQNILQKPDRSKIFRIRVDLRQSNFYRG